MNLCRFCVMYNSRRSCCDHPALSGFLGVRIPTNIRLYHCDFFVQSDKIGDVTLRLGNEKLVSYDYKNNKFNSKKTLKL